MPTIKGFKTVNGKMDDETSKKMSDALNMKEGKFNPLGLRKPTKEELETKKE